MGEPRIGAAFQAPNLCVGNPSWSLHWLFSSSMDHTVVSEDFTIMPARNDHSGKRRHLAKQLSASS